MKNPLDPAHRNAALGKVHHAGMPGMFAVGRRRSLLAAMRIGLALTVIAAVCPFGDRATAHLLAEHIRAGYPAYTQARVDSAVTTYLVLSSIIGALGVVAWLWTIRAVKAGKR